MSVTAAVRRRLRTSRDLAQRVLASAGVRDSAQKVAADAQEYWATPSSVRWKSDSHWRDSEVFAGTSMWDTVGHTHLELFERLARVVGHEGGLGAVVDWGGGGANAVSFAPRASSLVGVDISQDSLDECARQVAAVTSTPFRSVLIDVADPEAALPQLGERCDLFLCVYVFELIPSPEYGERLLRIAHQALAPGGLALIQVKYDPGTYRTRSRRRNYRTGIADMTTYRIDRFWTLAADCGFRPEVVHLVPRNELDERYAYFLLSRPE